VWIGRSVAVLPGVTIGDNAVIGANAVVTHDIPDFAVAVGVPARAISKTSNGREG
jgi:acetyltransferase-like isoleucine patch superfamily enzyme